MKLSPPKPGSPVSNVSEAVVPSEEAAVALVKALDTVEFKTLFSLVLSIGAVIILFPAPTEGSVFNLFTPFVINPAAASAVLKTVEVPVPIKIPVATFPAKSLSVFMGRSVNKSLAASRTAQPSTPSCTPSIPASVKSLAPLPIFKALVTASVNPIVPTLAIELYTISSAKNALVFSTSPS